VGEVLVVPPEPANGVMAAPAAPAASPVGSVTTSAPAGEGAGAEVVVEAGLVDVVVDDGRVVPVGRPEPPAGVEDGWVVLVVSSAGAVVVVEVEVVALSSGTAGAVVDVVDAGSVVVVVVVGSDAGVVVAVVSTVVEVVSVPGPGSGLPTSATAWAAGRLTRAMNMVVRARARRTRLNNTRISSPGVRGCPPE
jgi:hypothetical protein